MKTQHDTPNTSTDFAAMVVRPAQAARMIGVSKPHFDRLIYTGEIRSFKSGRARLIPVAELDRWIRAQIAA